ncbi:MAG: CHAD domain-containing protein [Planctomycetes bacterium]|nr:CHAD domain-containing protein [Planctomycetota bacterium]
MATCPDTSYRRLAVAYATRQLAVLPKHLKAVRDGSRGECVHQARVASRRLHVTLKAFGKCFAPKQAKRWRRQLQRLLKALGSARDRDVQIDQLAQILEATDDRRLRPGIERLSLRLRQERERLQDEVLRAVKRFDRSDTVDQMRQAFKALSPGKSKGKAALRSPLVFAEAGRQILAALQGLLGYRDCLWNASDLDRHHAMRIAAKKLRYAMEAFGAAYPSGLKPQITAARQLQTILGDLHDCDVWIDQLEDFVCREHERTEEYFGRARPFARLRPGLEHLIERQRRCREELFRDAGRTWEEFSGQAIWEKLVRTLDRYQRQTETQAEEPAASSGQPPETSEPATTPEESPGNGRSAAQP